MSFSIDTNIPAGNAVVHRIEGDDVWFSPDLRETDGHWFYWHLRVRGAAGRTVRFHIDSEYTLTARGPAVSTDGGWSWQWRGWSESEGWGFTHAFGPDDHDVRFSMAMPYTQRNWDRFAATFAGRPDARLQQLCRSRKGRPVELLEIGNATGARHNVLLTARHHCCEMMANFVLEGLAAEWLSDSPAGAWLRERAACTVVPFVDKDGVEDGDQGKNRRPHDHGRDYGSAAIYPEPAAIRRIALDRFGGRVAVAIDLHCPWIRGQWNEHVYQVGQRSEQAWSQQKLFAPILQKHAVAAGGLPYLADGDLPFGEAWNTGPLGEGLQSFSKWAANDLGATLASAIETPYATAGGVDVTPRSARNFGHALARAIREYLELQR